MAKVTIPDVASLADYVDYDFPASDWLVIDQARIDAFAEATGDRQWIHTDPERAKRESPFGTTIAHGHLTLSLAPMLLLEIVEVKGARLLVNPGFDKMRLRSPVLAGSRVRMRGSLARVRELKGGAVRATFHIIFDIEGQKKPAAFGDALIVYYP